MISEIKKICDMFEIIDYEIDANHKVSVMGSVNLSNQSLRRLPIQFKHISGDFSCAYNSIEDSYGFPETVGGDFNCGNNYLKNTIGFENYGNGHLHIHCNKITSLEGCPVHVNESFSVTQNKLSNLKGCPKTIRTFASLSLLPLETLAYFPEKADLIFMKMLECYTFKAADYAMLYDVSNGQLHIDEKYMPIWNRYKEIRNILK